MKNPQNVVLVLFTHRKTGMVTGTDHVPDFLQTVVNIKADHVLAGNHHFPRYRIIKLKHVVNQSTLSAIQFPFLFTGADNLPQFFFTAGDVFIWGISNAKNFCDSFRNPERDAHQRTGKQIHDTQRGHQMYDDFFHLVPDNDAGQQFPDDNKK